jgi:pyridoxal 5'-phosphate synthase pdxS subunit
MRAITSEMRRLTTLREDELIRTPPRNWARRSNWCAKWRATANCRCPNFSAGGIATPADAALVRQLGAEAVFVGSGIFKSSDPAVRARAIVKAATHFADAKAVLEASRGAGRSHEGPGRSPARSQRTCCKPAAGSRAIALRHIPRILLER